MGSSYSQYDDTLQGGKYPELEKATRQRWSRLLSQREEIVLRLIELEEGSVPPLLFLLGTVIVPAFQNGSTDVVASDW